MPEVTGMHLGYQLWKTGCEGGAMTSLTALPTPEHVCVASAQTILLSPAVSQLTGDFSRPVLLLLLLCLLTEQATI